MYLINPPYADCVQNGANGTQSFSEMPKYSYEELTVDIEQLPHGVDPAAREVSSLFLMGSWPVQLTCRDRPPLPYPPPPPPVYA